MWVPVTERETLREAADADAVIVDCGLGNVGALTNMSRRLGARVLATSDPRAVLIARRLILPGVGAFDRGANALEGLGLFDAVRQAREAFTPILGVCLGMQLLTRGSEEGDQVGLGFFDTECRRLPSDVHGTRIAVPHMGWAPVRAAGPAHPVAEAAVRQERFYFAHSYCVPADREPWVRGVTDYGTAFASVIAEGSVMGVQFHPEKSHRHGMEVLRAFLALDASGADS